MNKTYDYLVVGAGLFGAVVAERLASQTGRTVLVIDRRDHTGGNCHSEMDAETGIEVHRYGTHVFHTSKSEVWDYLNHFAGLNSYRHRVLARVGKCNFPMPVNLTTINAFFGRDFTPTEAKAFIATKTQSSPGTIPDNFEEMALATVGRELYDAFYAGYTRKQWGREPRDLPIETFSRLPVRFNTCTDYFHACRWQGLPAAGYASLFDRLLTHRLITVTTGVDFKEIRPHVRVRRKIVYSGPIDGFFDHQFGPLEWRSVRFSRTTVPLRDYQGCASVNFPDSAIPFTRIHEPRHLHPERNYSEAGSRSVIVHEYPCTDIDNPCYPVRTKANIALFERYAAFACREVPEVVFGGRLGTFSYLDMDVTIASALTCAASLIDELPK